MRLKITNKSAGYEATVVGNNENPILKAIKPQGEKYLGLVLEELGLH